MYVNTNSRRGGRIRRVSLVHDHPVLHPHHAEGAGAVPPVVGRFEVDGQERRGGDGPFVPLPFRT